MALCDTGHCNCLFFCNNRPECCLITVQEFEEMFVDLELSNNKVPFYLQMVERKTHTVKNR